jgi:DNA-binding transcriptional ArsR family regulator
MPPFDVDAGYVRGPQVEARPSAVLELIWALCRLHWHARLPDVLGPVDDVSALHDELEAVWDDGCPADASILAERLGALISDEADTFLRGFDRAAEMDGVGLDLRSEAPEIRAATIARLERLRRDPAFRRRYRALLVRLWELVRPSWEETGLAVARRSSADWSQRLRQGANFRELLPGKHPHMFTSHEQLLRDRPRIVLTPMYLATMGGFILDMATFVHIGGPASPADAERMRRDESELIANRMKVLSDGTRVALLRDLALEPASVMDLARRFHLAQPTVSTHVRLLREAGLLESQKDGARILYSAPRERLDRVLEDARHMLLEH